MVNTAGRLTGKSQKRLSNISDRAVHRKAKHNCRYCKPTTLTVWAAPVWTSSQGPKGQPEHSQAAIYSLCHTDSEHLLFYKISSVTYSLLPAHLQHCMFLMVCCAVHGVVLLLYFGTCQRQISIEVDNKVNPSMSEKMQTGMSQQSGSSTKTSGFFLCKDHGLFNYCHRVILPYLFHVQYITRSLRLNVPVPSLCASNEAIINQASKKERRVTAVRNVFTFEHLNCRGGQGIVPQEHFSANVAFVLC